MATDANPTASANGEPAPSPVPASVADIQPDWLAQALHRDFPAARVQGWQATRIGAQHGCASEVHRLTLDAANAPAAVVVKLWAGQGAAGLREARFFQVCSHPPLPFVIHCHCAQADTATGRGALVLEDLTDAEQGDCQALIPTERACALAAALATVHAQWWQRQQRDPQPTDWLPPAPATDRGADWYAQRRARFLQRFAGTLQGPALGLLAQVESRVEQAHARLQGCWTTLLHRDLHLDNVLFRRPGGAPVILDWALASLGPPAFELAVLCFELARLEDFDRVARSYRQTLQQQGGPALDADDFQAQLGAGLLLRFTTATCGIADWQAGTARGASIMATGIHRAARAVAFWQTADPALFRP